MLHKRLRRPPLRKAFFVAVLHAHLKNIFCDQQPLLKAKWTQTHNAHIGEELAAVQLRRGKVRAAEETRAAVAETSEDHQDSAGPLPVLALPSGATPSAEPPPQTS